MDNFVKNGSLQWWSKKSSWANGDDQLDEDKRQGGRKEVKSWVIVQIIFLILSDLIIIKKEDMDIFAFFIPPDGEKTHPSSIFYFFLAVD